MCDDHQEIRERINTLEQKIEQRAERIDQLEEQTDQFRQDAIVATKTLETLKDQHPALEQEINRIESNVEEAYQEVYADV